MAKRRFTSKDIGGELLPIITTGIYRDPLDSLREYIQNAIDADARHIEVAISADVASVRDDGTGMTGEVAERAIRLGMSEKNPSQDVGFRGIGVYSAFNTCDKLEIYTLPETGEASKLLFDFESIRGRLKDEEERRLTGEPSRLSLSELLTDLVWVEECDAPPFEGHGTLVIMTGVRDEVYKRLTDTEAVTKYLQSVVPLPFDPQFSCKGQIEAKFREEDYRVVDLTLRVDDTVRTLYRPYRDDVFTHGKGKGPKYFPLRDALERHTLGFAWVCLNDARKYLPAKEMRGLLIKKFGFSVGSRDQFTPFFSRAVFNNRTTGEIIVTDTRLIPNAARTEFEPGHVRDTLYVAFAQLASQISSWANSVQEELKSQEEIETISPRVFRIVKEIPATERDVDGLLRLNIELASYGGRLATHRRTLQKLVPDLLERTDAAIVKAKQDIADVLSKRGQRAEGRPRRVREAERAQAEAPTEEELAHAADRPTSLLDLLVSMDVEVPDAARLLIDYIDKEVLRQKLPEKEYSDLLEDLMAYLDETL